MKRILVNPWFERMLNEMLSHLACEAKNKEIRISWLKYINSLFNATGLKKKKNNKKNEGLC